MSTTNSLSIIPVKWPLRLVYALFIFLLFAPLYSWFTTDITEISRYYLGSIVIKNGEMSARAMGAFIELLTLCPIFYGLYQVHCLIILYGQGRLFTAEHVQCYRRIAWSFIAYALALFIAGIIIPTALTIGNPVGERILGVAIGSDMIIPCILGFVMMPLTHVMAAAQRLAEEQELTV